MESITPHEHYRKIFYRAKLEQIGMLTSCNTIICNSFFLLELELWLEENSFDYYWAARSIHPGLASSFWGIPRCPHAKLYLQSLQLVLGLSQCLCLLGRAWKTHKERSPRGILVKCTSHCNRLLSKGRSSSSNQSSPWRAALHFKNT